MTDLFIEVAQSLGPAETATLSFINGYYRDNLAQYYNLTYRDPYTGVPISIEPAFAATQNAYMPSKPQFGFVVFLHHRADMDAGTAYIMLGSVVDAVLGKAAPADGPTVTVPFPSGYSGSISYPTSFWIDEGPVSVIRGSPDGAATIRGTGAAQFIEAFGYNNTIFADGGGALIKAGLGSATVDAGTGSVTIVLDGYGNHVVGLNGNDAVGGSLGSTTIRFGDGNDSIEAGGYGNRIVLGNGNDTVDPGLGGAFVSLGNGSDAVTLTGYGNTVIGGDSRDRGDMITGGSGSDTITLGNGRDTIYTPGYSNLITVGNGYNEILAGNGGDHVVAGTSPTTETGETSVLLQGWSNVVDLRGGADTAFGGAGNDVITAAGGHDFLVASGIGDRLVLTQGTSTRIMDFGAQGMTVDVRSAADNLTITGLDKDPTAVVDLAIPGGRYGSVAAVMQALHGDGAGGTALALGPGGSIDFIDIAPGQLAATHFRIG